MLGLSKSRIGQYDEILRELTNCSEIFLHAPEYVVIAQGASCYESEGRRQEDKSYFHMIINGSFNVLSKNHYDVKKESFDLVRTLK